MPCVYMSEDAEATPTMALKSEVESLQRRLQEHTDFLERIRSASEEDILEIVRHLRSTDHISTLLSSYEGRDGVRSQISKLALTRSAMPSKGLGIEYELNMCHPTAYPPLETPSPSSTASPNVIGEFFLAPLSEKASEPSTDPSPYCDPRLQDLAVGYWTRIPIEDALAARAISHFLTTDHPVLGLFDADLFIQDLVDQSLNFCSSFLFHSIMSLACVC